MEFMISAATDIGIRKDVNQDSLTVQTIRTAQGKMVFALLCDGMGGLSSGELASATVVRAFREWVTTSLPELSRYPIEETVIQKQWTDLVQDQSSQLMKYGQAHGVRLGTTVAALLLTGEKYFVLNIGDSRVYELTNVITQLTTDQTLTEREVKAGRMTAEEAAVSPHRNVLLQSCGTTRNPVPEFLSGNTKQNAVYMLCSDGFRHVISSEEIYEKLQPDVLRDYATMNMNGKQLIELNKQRMEADNISVIVIRTY